jgi:predicted dehydrogenase
MSSYRVAIVGTGGIAKAHARALQNEKGRVEIVAGDHAEVKQDILRWLAARWP